MKHGAINHRNQPLRTGSTLTVVWRFYSGALLIAAATLADAQPYGLETRVTPPAYLHMPPLAGGKIPRLLSQTGAFTSMTDLAPAQGLIPYDLVVAFWSDGADKTRWAHYLV